MNILITGVAGFIGYHTARALLDQGHYVVGLDNVNDYYDVNLKKARLKLLTCERFEFYKIDLTDQIQVMALFERHQFDRVIHLAAHVGVRSSISKPHAYVSSNIVGFTHILEGCRSQTVPHLLYASSSSVYGLNTKVPHSVHDVVDHPASLYAATKKSNEIFAHTYSHLFNMPTTGLRLFTVYGPMGRPDMAYFKFTRAILNNEPIDVFNDGNLQRDFTYIDDVVESIVRLQNHVPTDVYDKANNSSAPCRVYNIGSNQSIKLLDFIGMLENIIGKKSILNMLPMQAGDVIQTCADVSELQNAIDFVPTTSLQEGLARFYDWYCRFYNTN